MAKEKYSVDFFKFISSGKDSYKNLLAPVMDALQPKSIIDLGTGSGTWLAAAKELGASRVLGLDGSWASAEHRHISDQEFQVVDFEDSLPDVGALIWLFVLRFWSTLVRMRVVELLLGFVSDRMLFSFLLQSLGKKEPIIYTRHGKVIGPENLRKLVINLTMLYAQSSGLIWKYLGGTSKIPLFMLFLMR